MKMLWSCRTQGRRLIVKCLLTQFGITFALDRVVLKSVARSAKFSMTGYMWNVISEMKTDIILAHAEFCQLNPHLMHPED